MENIDKEINEIFAEETVVTNPLGVSSPAPVFTDSEQPQGAGSDYTEQPEGFSQADISDSTAEEQMKPIDTANILIGLLDQIQTAGLSFAYEKKALKKEDIEQARAYKAQYGKDWGLKKSDAEIAQEIVALRNTYEKVKEYTKELPFTPKEQEVLRISMMQMIVKYNWKMSAEVAFIGAITSVFAPRMIPLFMSI
jgi:hypothetical protein